MVQRLNALLVVPLTVAVNLPKKSFIYKGLNNLNTDGYGFLTEKSVARRPRRGDGSWDMAGALMPPNQFWARLFGIDSVEKDSSQNIFRNGAAAP